MYHTVDIPAITLEVQGSQPCIRPLTITEVGYGLSELQYMTGATLNDTYTSLYVTFQTTLIIDIM